MSLECPECGSHDLRHSRLRGMHERFRALTGLHPLRCRQCRRRFVERTWSPSLIRYARCPRCWRMDLSRWSLEDYDAPASTRVALILGARPLRCEYCRLNFASFRRRRERYEGRKPVNRTQSSRSNEGGIAEKEK